VCVCVCVCLLINCVCFVVWIMEERSGLQQDYTNVRLHTHTHLYWYGWFIRTFSPKKSHHGLWGPTFPFVIEINKKY